MKSLKLKLGENTIELSPMPKSATECNWEWRRELCTVSIHRFKNRIKGQYYYRAQMSYVPAGSLDDIGLDTPFSVTSPQEVLDLLVVEFRIYKDWFDLVTEESGILADLLTKERTDA